MNTWSLSRSAVLQEHSGNKLSHNMWKTSHYGILLFLKHNVIHAGIPWQKASLRRIHQLLRPQHLSGKQLTDESPLPQEPGHFWSWTPSWHSCKHLNHKANTVHILKKKKRNAAIPHKMTSFLLAYLTQQKIPEKFNGGIKCNLWLMAYIRHYLPWPLKSHFKGRTHSLTGPWKTEQPPLY